MHQFKPKMTGGVDQSGQGLSPEAHKEWADKGGKHVVGLKKENPAPLAMQEKVVLAKNSNSEKRGMKNKDPKPESKVNPFHLGKKAGKSGLNEMNNSKVLSKKAVKSTKGA